MKKHKIIIEFESDAPEAAIREVAEHMLTQLESLEDGTIDLGTQAKPDEVYAKVTRESYEIE